MAEIVGVRFNNSGKAYYFDPCGMKLSYGTMVVVETAGGVEMGTVSIPNREVTEEEIKAPLKKILRAANITDKMQDEENRLKEKEARVIAEDLIKQHGLDMKLIDVEYTFDRSKILFYFTADGRVDFRELVKSMAGVFRTRIELRQIGVRDEARQIGSLGICGRPLCCSTFLDDFRPVSIKMAKEQGLSLNPAKISGVCGRLMCCLQYEQAAYDDALKGMPHKGDEVETPEGTGVVADTNTLKRLVFVKMDGEEGHKYETYKPGEFNIVGKEPTVSLDEVRERRAREAREAQEAKAAEEESAAFIFAASAVDEQKEDEPEEKKPQKNRRGKGGKRESDRGGSEAAAEPRERKSRPPKRNNRRGKGRPPRGGYTNR